MCKIRFWKKLFAFGFPYKYTANTALPTRQDGVENKKPREMNVFRELKGGCTQAIIIGTSFWVLCDTLSHNASLAGRIYILQRYQGSHLLLLCQPESYWLVKQSPFV